MKRYDVLKLVGSMQQIAYARPIRYQEGRATNLKAYEVKNGPLHFHVAVDKCLDITELTYKGINLTFLAKQGLIGRMDYDTHGEDGVKNLMGGLLFTCGLENTCLACEEDGKFYPMHGRIRSIPAEHICGDASWQGEDYVMEISGKMREAELFGKNLTLKRTVRTVYGERRLTITDEIENVSYRPEPMMILYHFNMGYPLLEDGAQVVLPTLDPRPRDEDAEKNQEIWDRMEAPVDNEPERVYLHELAADERGDTFACLVNDRLELGIRIDFNKKYLPHFVQWKSIASSDYVMGLEPTNSGVYGRNREGEQLHVMQPFEKEIITLGITVLEGKKDLEEVRSKAKELVEVARTGK